MSKLNLTDEQRSALSAIGSAGGKTTAARKGKRYMREIGRRGAEKRWGKPKE